MKAIGIYQRKSEEVLIPHWESLAYINTEETVETLDYDDEYVDAYVVPRFLWYEEDEANSIYRYIGRAHLDVDEITVLRRVEI